MVPVVMEPRCLETSKWQGVVGGKLGGRLYCNLVQDKPEAFEVGIGTIDEALKQMEVHPSNQAGRAASSSVQSRLSSRSLSRFLVRHSSGWGSSKSLPSTRPTMSGRPVTPRRQ
jgi:hypothetical protein